MSEERILFTAKKGKWYVSKKLKIDENTRNVEIARILAGINETISLKIKEFLPFDMQKLEEIADEIYVAKKGKVKEEEVSEALVKLKSPATTKKMNAITESKEGKEILKRILTEIVLERLGFKLHVEAKMIEKFIEKSQ
ncbi:conserved hypothetical protein [Methanococcus vannielii SB]|uniref:DUF2666 domain-containing protein n=1 Tax=Methanococcus vannielii (strain ATCC 35089 / DSM 1224 / JCM 13029 / OCM 148 / SB) TaxID=406327 RepID=A6UR52_METVS|nr:DUF2666 domain-containing protein [Methanococcus vannielii]ABR54974.1 conserved hypothetical protein [Methanococcus vannielii SB]